MEFEKLKTIVTPILNSKGLFWVDLKISRDNVIELFIDSPTGVNIQTCIEVSREIENSLNRDEEDFELTVSSAGIGYPFKVEEQFAKNIGNTVEVRLKSGRKINGILTAFDAETVQIEYEEKRVVEGSKKKQTVKTNETIRREDIKEIKDVINF